MALVAAGLLGKRVASELATTERTNKMVISPPIPAFCR